MGLYFAPYMSCYLDGNPDVYSDSMYNGGTGKSFSSQYLCSSNCNDIGGFCGNGVLENGTQSASNESFYVANTNSDKSVVKNYYIGNFEHSSLDSPDTLA